MGIRDGLPWFREKSWLFAGSCDFELVGFVKVEKFGCRKRKNAEIKRIYYCIYPSKKTVYTLRIFSDNSQNLVFSPSHGKSFKLFLNRVISFIQMTNFYDSKANQPPPPPRPRMISQIFRRRAFLHRFTRYKNRSWQLLLLNSFS